MGKKGKVRGVMAPAPLSRTATNTERTDVSAVCQMSARDDGHPLHTVKDAGVQKL